MILNPGEVYPFMVAASSDPAITPGDLEASFDLGANWEPLSEHFGNPGILVAHTAYDGPDVGQHTMSQARAPLWVHHVDTPYTEVERFIVVSLPV